MKIALDVFGGDHAPQATVEGAILAIKETVKPEFSDVKIILVGNQRKLESEIQIALPDGIEIYDIKTEKKRRKTDPHIDGDDPNSPIRTALRLHRTGEFDAVVSAGKTGAQLIASLMELEKIPGITRPAVGSFLPTSSGQCFLLDVGASLVATPHHFVQFAAMGHVYVSEIMGIDKPRVGVLNVGKENDVGDGTAIEAHRLLADSGFNFMGFVEGNDISSGVVDVVVTNGFIGNILLKYCEGFPKLLKNYFPKSDSSKSLQSIKKRFDYQTFGGEPLLGVRGISIICHGASTPKAIAAGIMQAYKIVSIKFHEKLENFLMTKFDSYFSRVKYLRSFRRSFRLPDRFRFSRQNDETVK